MLALVQVIACRLLGDKPLSEPMLTNSQLDPWGKLPAKFEQIYKTFHWWKCFWNVDCDRMVVLSGGRCVNQYAAKLIELCILAGGRLRHQSSISFTFEIRHRFSITLWFIKHNLRVSYHDHAANLPMYIISIFRSFILKWRNAYTTGQVW